MRRNQDLMVIAIVANRALWQTRVGLQTAADGPGLPRNRALTLRVCGEGELMIQTGGFVNPGTGFHVREDGA